MATTDLLKVVLPPEGEGVYCLLGLKQGGGYPKQLWAETLADAEKHIADLLNDLYDVYFACAKYTDEAEGRVQKNSNYFKSFWLDIDCGVGKPYADQAEGLDALKEFCIKIDLPLPTVVNSGRGVHAYWNLTTTVDREHWLPVASRIKALCEEHGLEADPSRTAESASVLRVPETWNFKNDPPFPVEILKVAKDIEYDEVKRRLGVLIAPSYIPRSFSEASQAIRSNIQSRFKTIMLKTIDGNGCAQIKNLVENQDKMDEPRWRAVLSIAAHCIDRDTAIHMVSSGHPDYNAEATEEKANEIKGPYTCAKMEYYNPGFCGDCPHKDKIKNPIQLGNEIAAAETNEIVEKEEDGTTSVYTVPELPYPYFRGKNGGVYRATTEEDGEPALIYEHDLYVVKRLFDPRKGDAIWIRLHLPRDGVREFSIPQTEALTHEKLRDKLAWYGVVAAKKQMDNIMNYLITFVKELQHKSEVEIMRTQFGWTDENDQFILGDQEISADKVSYSPPSSSTGSLATFMSPTGDFKEWQRIANIYSAPGFEPHAFGFFTAFGAPLLKHLNLRGAIINLINNRSGTGKSTILKMCNSVWGHPEELMLQWKDTQNSMIHRLGIMNTLPVTIDEITKLSGEHFSDLAYSITQGRGKNRMQQHDNAERLNTTKWSTIALCSANASFYDKLATLKATPDGEMMRLIEYKIEMTEALSKEEADTIFNGLYAHYGHAGFEYAKYLVANLETAIDTVMQVQQKLDQEVGFTSRERFWSGVAACNIAGALMAKDLGIIPDFNVGRVYKWLVQMLKTMRTDIKAPANNNITSVFEFMNDHRAETLVINGNADRRSGMQELPIAEPKFSDIKVRIEPDTGVLMLRAKAFREFCSKNQITLKDLLDGLHQDKIFIKQDKKRIGKGTKIPCGSVDVYIFNMEHDEFFDTKEAIIEAVKDSANADTRD